MRINSGKNLVVKVLAFEYQLWSFGKNIPSFASIAIRFNDTLVPNTSVEKKKKEKIHRKDFKEILILIIISYSMVYNEVSCNARKVRDISFKRTQLALENFNFANWTTSSYVYFKSSISNKRQFWVDAFKDILMFTTYLHVIYVY